VYELIPCRIGSRTQTPKLTSKKLTNVEISPAGKMKIKVGENTFEVDITENTTFADVIEQIKEKKDIHLGRFMANGRVFTSGKVADSEPYKAGNIFIGIKRPSLGGTRRRRKTRKQGRRVSRHRRVR